MLLDVPFIPDEEYAGFLADHITALTSVHFSLSAEQLSDARQRMGHGDLPTIVRGLKRLDGVNKYVLMNARLHAPEKYFDTDGLAQTAHLLTTLRDEIGLAGVIFADPYYLQALSNHSPDMAETLEAVPSINTLLDSTGKTFSVLTMIEQTAFRLPAKLVLDRSLNRDLRQLETVTTGIRHAFPDIKLHLMVNEGCLHHCPYKPAHDAHVSLIVEKLCGDRTFAMNRDYGCIRRMLDDPGTMLASPFIRPEDACQYESHVDGIKICGRNRGTHFLTRAVTAYIEKGYTGNLLDLMDAMGDLDDRVRIPNETLPDIFFQQVTTCDKRCTTCGWCGATMKRIATRFDPGLPIYQR